MALKENFEKVGNPSISDDYVASDFSSSNYIKLSNLPTNTLNDWEFCIKFTAPPVSSAVNFFFGNKEGFSGIVLNVASGKLTAYLGNGSGWNITSGTIYSETLTEGDDYYCLLGYNGSEYYLKYSQTNENFITVFSIQSDLKVVIKDLYAGLCWNFYNENSMRGSIYLKETHLYSGGEIIWSAVQDIGTISGSITVSKGYYTDGNNVIKFTSEMTKTLTEASGYLGYKNNVVLTLDSNGVSSFLLKGVSQSLTGYILTKTLDTPEIYLDNNKSYIFGDNAYNGLEMTIKEGGSGVLSAWERPNLTSANSYGVVSDSRNNSSEAGWMALDGNLSSNFVPNTSAGWWKWELPTTLTFTEGESGITWVHRNNSEVMSGSDTLQFFADEECTIPLTNTFADLSSSNATVDLPVVGNIETNIIYLKIKAHSGWGGAAEIKFTNVLEGQAFNSGSITFRSGFKYINEDVGSFIMLSDKTKDLDQLIFSGDSKSEQMYLNMFIDNAGETDFYLTSQKLTDPPSGYKYFEEITTVYLDSDLTYIYGTTPQEA